MMINGFVLRVVFFKPTPVNSMFSSPFAPDSPGFITVPPSAFGANARIRRSDEPPARVNEESRAKYLIVDSV
jgi:hypothetical protein